MQTLETMTQSAKELADIRNDLVLAKPSDEDIERMVTAFKKLAESFIEFAKKVCNWIADVVTKFYKALGQIARKSNPHVFHLAARARKRRTRKKNMRKIMKVFV